MFIETTWTDHALRRSAMFARPARCFDIRLLRSGAASLSSGYKHLSLRDCRKRLRNGDGTRAF